MKVSTYLAGPTLSTTVTVLALTDTWLDEHQTDVISIPGYQFISKPRKGGRGGGVGFLIKKGVFFSVLD